MTGFMQQPSRIRASLTQCVWGLTSLLLVLGALEACKKKPPLPVPDPEPREESAESPASSSAPEPSSRPVSARCRELPQSDPFRIGELVTSRVSPEEAEDGGPDEEDEVPDPFSVELGPARADEGGFVVSALRSVKGQSHALLALVAGDAGSGKLVDLGAVHGDPDAPLFAVQGKDVLVAVPDSDAGGSMLKIGRVRDARGSAVLSWGPEITGVRHDSTLALEQSGERALLAYAAEVAGKIRVFGALLDPSNPKQKLAPEPLSAPGPDVDSPRLALRKGGYWLAVARTLDTPKSKAKPAPRPLDGGEDSSEEDIVVDLGVRRIELVKLDAAGKPASSALVVSSPNEHPMSFELAAGADGGAYVGYRSDDSAPGSDGGALTLVHVRPDGTLEKLQLAGDPSGTGTPALLVDASAPERPWLAAAGENGATWFGRIASPTTLSADSVLRGGDLIAAREGKLLVARAKGTAAELSVLECKD